MTHDEIVKSLTIIRPNSAYILQGNVLTWQDQQQTEPTVEEIEAGWVAYKAKIENDKAEAIAKKAAAEAKLVALGLDLDDLRALGL